LETCFYYEYARELQPLRDAVDLGKRLQTFGPDHKNPDLQKQLDQMLRKSSALKLELLRALVRWPFPQAWQSLDQSDKDSLIDTLPDAIDALKHGNPLNLVESDPTEFVYGSYKFPS